MRWRAAVCVFVRVRVCVRVRVFLISYLLQRLVWSMCRPSKFSFPPEFFLSCPSPWFTPRPFNVSLPFPQPLISLFLELRRYEAFGGKWHVPVSATWLRLVPRSTGSSAFLRVTARAHAHA